MAKHFLRTRIRTGTGARAARGKALRALRWLGVALLAAAAAFAFLISAFGGQGSLPSWAALYRAAGIANGSPALDGDGNAATEPTKIHFIDVGQGDSVLIEQDGAYALIDAGTAASETALLSYLEQLSVQKLQVVVMTHPHADHIGSMAAVLKKIPAETLILPDFSLAAEYPTSATLEKVLAAADAAGVSAVTAEAGQQYAVGGGTLTVVGAGIAGDNYNNLSVSTLFTAGAFRFLDTGDAEAEEENALLESGANLSATVFKAGHHGSNTSNTLPFLRAVRPQIAVVSCGLNNDYGHPHQQTLDHFAAVGANVYRTDEMGSVVVGYAPESGVKLYATKSQEAAA